jgi:hypothetical protein
MQAGLRRAAAPLASRLFGASSFRCAGSWATVDPSALSGSKPGKAENCGENAVARALASVSYRSARRLTGVSHLSWCKPRLRTFHADIKQRSMIRACHRRAAADPRAPSCTRWNVLLLQTCASQHQHLLCACGYSRRRMVSHQGGQDDSGSADRGAVHLLPADSRNRDTAIY